MKMVEYGGENTQVIMLLHGGGLSWWNYRAEAELLKEQYHVTLPILDGHADSGAAFTSIEDNARELICCIDERFGGHVLAIGGLSLGGQVLVEMLSQRGNICKYAIIESASVIPAPLTGALTAPAFGMSYGLIKKRWFSQLQFKALKIQPALFEDYYRDSCKIEKQDMIRFLEASLAYSIKPELEYATASALILAGSREQKRMLRSADMLHAALRGSRLRLLDGYNHGELSLDRPLAYLEMLRGLLTGTH